MPDPEDGAEKIATYEHGGGLFSGSHVLMGWGTRHVASCRRMARVLAIKVQQPVVHYVFSGRRVVETLVDEDAEPELRKTPTEGGESSASQDEAREGDRP